MSGTSRPATTAVILARGEGTRMRAAAVARTDAGGVGAALLTPEQRAAAAAGQKGMMPMHGRPLLDHVLAALADGGVLDVIFVVAPGSSPLRDHYGGTHPPRRLAVRFAEQSAALGTAHALLAAAPMLGDGDFLMLNADNLYPVGSVRALVEAPELGLIAYDADALVSQGNITAEKVLRFALLDLAPDGTLREIVEKPGADHPLARAPERWVSMNLWRFAPSILEDCAAIAPSVRGELELADAVRRAIARGARFVAHRQRVGVLDLSSRGDIAAVEAALAGREASP